MRGRTGGARPLQGHQGPRGAGPRVGALEGAVEETSVRVLRLEAVRAVRGTEWSRCLEPRDWRERPVRRDEAMSESGLRYAIVDYVRRAPDSGGAQRAGNPAQP